MIGYLSTGQGDFNQPLISIAAQANILYSGPYSSSLRKWLMKGKGLGFLIFNLKISLFLVPFPKGYIYSQDCIFWNLPLLYLVKQNLNKNPTYAFCVKFPSIYALYFQWFCCFVRTGLCCSLNSQCLAYCIVLYRSLVDTPKRRKTYSQPPSLAVVSLGVWLQF